MSTPRIVQSSAGPVVRDAVERSQMLERKGEAERKRGCSRSWSDLWLAACVCLWCSLISLKWVEPKYGSTYQHGVLFTGGPKARSQHQIHVTEVLECSYGTGHSSLMGITQGSHS